MPFPLLSRGPPLTGSRDKNSRDRAAIVPHDPGVASLASGHSGFLPSI